MPCNTDAKRERHRSPVKRNCNEAKCFECKRRQLLQYQTENIAYYTLKGRDKKNQIKLTDESIKRLIDMMSKSENKNKNFN